MSVYCIIRMNLNITSFNCKGFKYRNYEYIRELFESCDILLLQETWLFRFQFSEVEKILNTCRCFGVSAMEEEDIGRSGRPHGGCLILYKKSSVLPISQIDSNNTRICAGKIDSHQLKILFISVYMPCDDGSSASYDSYVTVLYDLSALLSLYDGYQCVIGGDFNTDFVRNNVYSNTLKSFLEVESLTCVNYDKCFGNNFTFVSTGGSKSFIDHIMVNDGLSEKYSNINVLYDGNNLSDHNPITFEISFDVSINYDRVLHASGENDVSTDIDWENTTASNIIDYKQCLNDFLNAYETNSFNEICSCNDYFCCSHNNYALNSLDYVVDSMVAAARLTLPNKIYKSSKMKCIPGWNQYVRKFKESAIFWHGVWKSADCPTDGVLWEIRKFSRLKYHAAIRYVKNNEEYIVKSNIALSLKNKSFNEFWDVIRKMNLNKVSLPSMVDNVVGEEKISVLFKEKYEELYSLPNDSDDDICSKLNREIRSKCMLSKCNYTHNINVASVIKAAKKLKQNKNDIFYISSNHIIYGSFELFNILSNIFNLLLTHGISNVKLNKSMLVPIPKNNRKSLVNSSNYRAIALSSIIGKLFEYIILDIIQSNIYLNPNQFGYRSNVSTSHCSFVINNTIQYFRNNNSNVYCLFLDATKAFDMVKHDKLFQSLLEMNVCPLFARLILKMYEMSEAYVRWNKSKSSSFKVERGVKQGAVLSPLLFSIYLNSLLELLNRSGYGCYMGGRSCNVFAYADDIVVLSPSVFGLKTLIKLISTFSKDFDIQFNIDKCFLIAYSDSQVDPNIFMNNIKIKLVSEVKHLGFYLNNSRFIYDFENIIKDISIKTNILLSKFNMLDNSSLAFLFNSNCLSLYGCEVWDLNSPLIKNLDLTWRKCVKRILRIPLRTRTTLLPYLINSDNIIRIICYRQLNFFIKGRAHKCGNIKFHFDNFLIHCYNYSTNNLNYILDLFGCSYDRIFVNKKFKMAHVVEEDCLWRVKLIEELCHMRDFKLFDYMSPDMINYLLYYLCTL